MKSKGKKVIIIIGLFVLIALVIIKVGGFQYSGIDKKATLTIENKNIDLIEKLKDTNKIEVYHDYHADNVKQIKPVVVKDKNIINNYLNLLSKNVKKSSEDISGASVNNQKLVFYTDNEVIELSYTYDDLYNFGFITYKGQNIYIDYDLFRLISNTQNYAPKSSNVPNDVKELFEEYNWTPSFLISKHKNKISDDLIYAPEKGIDEIYWAYNLQLSKAINFDFSNLLGKNVDAEVYYLLEPLPKFAYPIVDTKAVILRYNGKIVGSYIDSGIKNRAVCSLDRKSFEDITNKSLEDYLIENHIDKDSELNKEIAQLSNAELIEAYYKSQSDKDVNRYLATLDIGSILSLLERSDFSTLKHGLFDIIDKNHEVFKNANEVKILEVNNNTKSDNTKEVNIKINILKSNQVTIDEGIYNMIVFMKKNENNTYKINSIGF